MKKKAEKKEACPASSSSFAIGGLRPLIVSYSIQRGLAD